MNYRTFCIGFIDKGKNGTIVIVITQNSTPLCKRDELNIAELTCAPRLIGLLIHYLKKFVILVDFVPDYFSRRNYEQSGDNVATASSDGRQTLRPRRWNAEDRDRVIPTARCAT